MIRRGLWADLILMLMILIAFHQPYGQTKAWQLVNIRFAAVRPGFLYSVSTSGRYILQYDYYVLFNDTTDLSEEMVTDSRASATRWWHDTILYQEFEWPDFASPHCSNTSLLPIGIYTATTKTKQLFCLNALKPHKLERYPFDDYVLFADSRYLINLHTNTVSDLQGQLTTRVSIADTHQWIGNGETWWDAVTRLPKARINTLVNLGVSFDTADEQILQLCPLASGSCQTIVSVQQYIHGSLSDAVLSADGQTLLWSAFQIPTTETVHAVRPGSGIIIDVVAFATNIQTGTTQEIFRLSHQNTSPAKGISTNWSVDGQMLAVSMTTLDQSSPNDQYNGVLLVAFAGPSTPTPTNTSTNTPTS